MVLASISDYFRVMFTTEVIESRQKEITLEGVSAKGIFHVFFIHIMKSAITYFSVIIIGMQFLLDYAYSSRLALNLSNIQDVLSTASHVQVVTVVDACSNYLQVSYNMPIIIMILIKNNDLQLNFVL